MKAVVIAVALSAVQAIAQDGGGVLKRPFVYHHPDPLRYYAPFDMPFPAEHVEKFMDASRTNALAFWKILQTDDVKKIHEMAQAQLTAHFQLIDQMHFYPSRDLSWHVCCSPSCESNGCPFVFDLDNIRPGYADTFKFWCDHRTDTNTVVIGPKPSQ